MRAARTPELAGLGIRPALLEAWAPAGARRLTLVTAPGGSGKTTLLRAWRARADGPSIWLELDETHDDPVALAEALALAMGAAVGREDFGSEVLRALPHLERPTADAIAPFWARAWTRALEQRTRPVAVFLDNYHRLGRGSESDRLLGHLLRDDASPLRFVVATRGAPPEAAARLRADGEVLDVGREALHLDAEQVRALLRHFDVEPDDALVGRLAAATGGWATGVLLSARGLARVDPSEHKRFLDGLGTHTHLFEYVAGELLAGEDRACTEAAELAAVLGPCARETLAEALPDDVPAACLQDALDRGLLLDDGERVFVHHLWEELLLRRLRERSSRDAWRALHQRLAGLTASLDPRRAAVLLARGEAWDDLVAVLARHGREWLNLGHEAFVMRHVAALPDAHRQGHVEIDYLEALALRRRDVDLALDALWCVADRFRAAGLREQEVSALFDAQILAANRNRRDLMARIARRVLSLRRIATDPRVRALSLVGLAFAALLSGRTRIADAILRRTQTRALLASERASASLLRLNVLRPQGRWSESLELVLAGLADEEIREHAPSRLMFELERAYLEGLRGDDPGDAAERASRVREDLGAFGLTMNEAMACEVVGLLESRRGRREAARDAFGRGGRLAEDIGRLDLLAHAHGLVARELWLEGRRDAAVQEARRAIEGYRAVPERDLRVAMSSARAVLPVRVLAECGETADARRAAAKVVHLVDRMDVPLANFAAHVQHARIAARADDREEARRHLRRASALAETAHLRDAPPETEPGLLRWAEQEAARHGVTWRAVGPVEPANGAPRRGWSVASLGGLRVAFDGRPIPENAWRGATTRRLLLRLLCAGSGGARREVLQAEFWPDHPPDRAHRNLRVALSRLRAALAAHDEGAIRIEGDRVDLAPGLRAGWDVERLEHALLEQGVDASLLALYHGPFAPEVYDAWAEPVRERIEDLVAGAALAAVDARARAGDGAGALAQARRMLERRPADEALWARWIELRLAAGDAAGARRALQEARASLARELGLDGDDVLRSVARRVARA